MFVFDFRDLQTVPNGGNAGLLAILRAATQPGSRQFAARAHRRISLPLVLISTMETPEHQELRSRQMVSKPAIIKTAMLAGFVFFIMSGGGPWSTAGTMNAIMGRDISLPMHWLIFWHFAVALFYVWIIARVIYSLSLIPGIAVGVGVALGLYVLNTAVFYGLGFTQQSPEGKTLLLHIVFGLITSALYKAFSVPKPLVHDA